MCLHGWFNFVTNFKSLLQKNNLIHQYKVSGRCMHIDAFPIEIKKMLINNVNPLVKTATFRGSLQNIINIFLNLKISFLFECQRYFRTAAANFPAVTLRYARFDPGVNSRAELVTIAPGLRPDRRSPRWPGDNIFTAAISPCKNWVL